MPSPNIVLDKSFAVLFALAKIKTKNTPIYRVSIENNFMAGDSGWIPNFWFC